MLARTPFIRNRKYFNKNMKAHSTVQRIVLYTYPKCRFFCWWDESWRWQWKALSHTLHVKDSSVNGITKWNENKLRRLHVVCTVHGWSQIVKRGQQKFTAIFMAIFFFSRLSSATTNTTNTTKKGYKIVSHVNFVVCHIVYICTTKNEKARSEESRQRSSGRKIKIEQENTELWNDGAVHCICYS